MKCKILASSTQHLAVQVTTRTNVSEKTNGNSYQEGHLVFSVSKTLSQAEQRYLNTKREALAIVVVVKCFKQFFFPDIQLPKTVSASITRWDVSSMAYINDQTKFTS